MTALYFSLPKGITAAITSDTTLAYGELEEYLMQAYIPGIQRIQSAAKPTISLVHRESAQKYFSSKGPTASITDSWNGKLSQDVYHLLYSMARKQFLKKHAYTIHAACVDVNGLTLIAGHSGSGKTAVSTDLVARGHKILSGNKTLCEFGKYITAIAGTKTITAKSSELQGMNYGDRSAVMLGEEEYAKPSKIKAIYFVRLNDGREEYTEQSHLSATHMLYPFFLDTVNADTQVLGKVYDGEVPKAKDLLATELPKVLPTIRTYTISGSKEFIVQRILRNET